MFKLGAMSASSSCLIAVLVIAASPAAAQNAMSSAAGAASGIHATCRIPFETLKDSKTGKFFPLSAAFNDNARLSENLRQRYIVADLNSTDEDGNCRGVQEHFTPVGELSEFPRLRAIAAARDIDVVSLANESVASQLASESTPGDATGLAAWDLKSYLQQVHRYKTDAIAKPAVSNGYCVGQMLSLCEIANGQPKLIYRFVTSSSRSTPPLYRYYAPINFIKSRSWSSDRKYTPADARRDERVGGGRSGIVPFANGGNPIEMPNFLHFLPMPGYVGETANGIHQIAGGLDSGGTFGAPVSLGCIRLNKFQSKLARWWTPTQAKLFVHFEPNRYRTYGVAATGKARGFQTPGQVRTANAAVTVRPADRAPPSRPKAKSEPAAKSTSLFGLFSSAWTVPH